MNNAYDSPENLYSKDASHRLEMVLGKPLIHVIEFDENGEVFGTPGEVELYLIKNDDAVMFCEFELWLNYEYVYIFELQCAWYERHHQLRVARKILISPYIDEHSKHVAERLEIELYQYPEDVKP